MRQLSFLLLPICLVGCQLPANSDDLGRTIEAGQQIAENQKLKEAGSEVITGGKEILSTGKEAAVNLGSGAQKVLSNGKVIFDETQQILNELKVETEAVAQPQDGDTVWVRQEDQGCEGDEPCFAWRADEESPWQQLKGQIQNIDDLPAKIDNWQVKLSTLSDFMEAWQVDEVLKTDGQ